MPTYYCFVGIHRDTELKYVVQRGKIDTYDKGDGVIFFTFHRKWRLVSSFEINDETKVSYDLLHYNNGNGVVRLDDGKNQRDFYIFKFAVEFSREVERCRFS